MANALAYVESPVSFPHAMMGHREYSLAHLLHTDCETLPATVADLNLVSFASSFQQCLGHCELFCEALMCFRRNQTQNRSTKRGALIK